MEENITVLPCLNTAGRFGEQDNLSPERWHSPNHRALCTRVSDAALDMLPPGLPRQAIACIGDTTGTETLAHYC